MAGASIKIGANSSEFQKQMKEVTNQLKLVSSECGVATQKAKLFGTAQEQLAAKHKELTAKIEAQNQMMKLHKDRIAGINSDIDKQRGKQAELSANIENTTKKYKESVQQTGKNSEESKKLKEELNGLKEEYAKNEKAIENNNKKLVDATIKMNNTEKAMLQNQKALEDINKTMRETPLDNLVNKFDNLGNKALDLGKKISIASGAVVGLGAGAVAAYKQVDEGMDNVVKATGVTGETAKQFEQNYKNVASSINENFGVIGSTLGEVNTRFGFTGDKVEQATQKFLQFSRINGIDATQAVQLVSRAMGDAGIEADSYGEMLDNLTVAAQASGIDIAKLTELCTKYGAPMRALGMDTKESIAIFASWELAGVNTEIAFSGMKAAIGKWGKEGKDARKEFKKTLADIEKAPNIATATAKAIEVFVQKAGPDLADAIKGGRFEYSKFLDLLEGSTGAVENTFNEVTDETDQMEIAMQALKVASGDLGKEILAVVAPAISGFTKGVQNLSEWFRNLNEPTKRIIVICGGIVAGAGPAVIAFGLMAKGISNIIKGFKDVYSFAGNAIGKIKSFGTSVVSGAKAAGKFALNLGKMAIEFGKNAIQAGIATVKFIAHKVATIASTIATNGLALAQAALNFIMSLNPITLIIIAIGALVAAIVVLWNKCDWFRKMVTDMFNALKIAWKATLDFFKSVWEWFVSLWQVAVEFFKSIWQGVCDAFKFAWQLVCDYFNFVWSFWQTVFTTVVNAIKLIWQGACDLFKNVWNSVCNFFTTVFNGFKNGFNNIVSGIRTIWNNVCNFFKTAWNGACNAVTGVFRGVKNTVVGIAQAMTNSVIRGINWCITQLNKVRFKVPDWVPAIGGKSWGVNIPKISQVNWLYKGGIIERPTILGNIGVGDKYKGTGNQAEAIIPLEVMYKKMTTIVNSAINGEGVNRTNRIKENGDMILNIQNFNNNREQDIEQLCKEMEFYRKKYSN